MTPPPSLKILRIPILPFGLVNAHLIIGPGGCVLVDTGLPGSEHRIAVALKQHGLRFDDIRLIVVTHAHVDHAGNAAFWRNASGAPILAHEDDLAYFRGRQTMQFCPTGWFGRLFLRTGLILEPYTPFTPDILLGPQEAVDLGLYGMPGVARHTPGHTPGSISVELDSRDALVGDLISSGILLGGLVRTGRAKRPPFEDDPELVARMLLRMVADGHQRFHMGHGGPLNAGEVERHARGLAQLGRRTAA